MANPARAYLTTQVETTTQGELLIMLYDAAIKFLKRANLEIDNKDYAKKGIYISKAMAIIHELTECLNKEKGGEITPKLAQIYLFCTSQLIKANIRLDKKMIDDVMKILEGLRSAYAEIIPMHENKGDPRDTRNFSGMVPPAPPGQPAAPPQMPQAAQQPVTPVPPVPPQAAATPPQAPAAPPQEPAAPPQEQAKTDPPAPQTAQETAQPKPAPQPVQPPQPTPPPKLRTAFNAAKFRAANAYSNNNS